MAPGVSAEALAAPTLPVVRVASSALLETEQGAPVWPISTESEFVALLTIARTFGATLRELDPASLRAARNLHPDSDTGESVGLVGAFETEYLGAARLYAHLTRRASLKSPIDIAGPLPRVIIGDSKDLNASLMKRMSVSSSSQYMSGFVVASRDHPQRQVLVASAAAYLAPLTDVVRQLEYSYSVDASLVRSDKTTFMGRSASNSQVLAALGAPKELCRLHTHSDGVDAYLTPSSVLCPAKEMGSHDASYPCGASGMCHRLRFNLSEIQESEGIVGPSVILAGVLIFVACWGASGPATLYHEDWRLGRHLSMSDGVGVLIAPWTVILAEPTDGMEMMIDLQRGRSVADAVFKHNFATISGPSGQSCCIIGDPDLHFGSNVGTRPLSVSCDSIQRRGEVDFLRLVIESAAARAESSREGALDILPGASMLGRRMLPLLRELNLRDLSDDREEIAVAVADVRQTFLDFVTRVSPIFNSYWSGSATFSKIGEAEPSARKPGPDLLSTRASFGQAWMGHRRLSTCSRVGIFEDCPLDSPYAFEATELDLTLYGPELREGSWSARLIAYGGLPEDRAVWKWPTETGGSFVRIVKLQTIVNELPKGPVMLCLALMIGLDIYHFIQRVPSARSSADKSHLS